MVCGSGYNTPFQRRARYTPTPSTISLMVTYPSQRFGNGSVCVHDFLLSDIVRVSAFLHGRLIRGSRNRSTCDRVSTSRTGARSGICQCLSSATLSIRTSPPTMVTLSAAGCSSLTCVKPPASRNSIPQVFWPTLIEVALPVL